MKSETWQPLENLPNPHPDLRNKSEEVEMWNKTENYKTTAYYDYNIMKWVIEKRVPFVCDWVWKNI